MRAYTVVEIDELRMVVETKYLFGTYDISRARSWRVYREDEKVRAVEEMVRTHMAAGHTAQDLLDSEKDQP